jgi:4-amino-4-deoxy-L-arabinose transferase-like glycosyltransferase
VWSLIAALLMAAFYLITSLYIDSHRLFWYDEIFTVRIAWLPHWTTIWAALHHAIDAQPPLYYLVVRTFGKLFGHSEVAARLPSSLAMVAGLLITFRLCAALYRRSAWIDCAFCPHLFHPALLRL